MQNIEYNILTVSKVNATKITVLPRKHANSIKVNFMQLFDIEQNMKGTKIT